MYDCKCYLDSYIEEANLYCHKCKVGFAIPVEDFIKEYDPTVSWDNDWDDVWTDSLNSYCEDENDHYGDLSEAILIQRPNDASWNKVENENRKHVGLWRNSCQHSQTPFLLPSGTKVHCSAWTAPLGRKPDFALYLDNIWPSPGFAYYIDWPDYDIPNEDSLDDAILIVADVYKKARNGLFVEVGCVGGHGRTGTVLAIMCVLDGLDTGEAISYVKSKYCSRAIESPVQEWLVDYARCFTRGGKTKILPSENYLFTFQEPFDWENWDINNVLDAAIDEQGGT
jgi:protein-tyrosine phosphatase